MPQQTGSDLDFTEPASDENVRTIETIYAQIMNQHPEDISALADQWQNAHNLLASIRQQLLDASNRLYDKAWRSAEARDAFMKKGPGETLAYLDEWMTATLNNTAALRAQVGIVTQARSNMDKLWTEYQAAVDDAKFASTGRRFWEGFKSGGTLFIYDGEAGIQAAETEDVQKKHSEFNRRAQELAYQVANQYLETYSTLNGGHGPPFVPTNAVLNAIGHPPVRIIYTRAPGFAYPAVGSPHPMPIPPSTAADAQRRKQELAALARRSREEALAESRRDQQEALTESQRRQQEALAEAQRRQRELAELQRRQQELATLPTAPVAPTAPSPVMEPARPNLVRPAPVRLSTAPIDPTTSAGTGPLRNGVIRATANMTSAAETSAATAHPSTPPMGQLPGGGRRLPSQPAATRDQEAAHGRTSAGVTEPFGSRPSSTAPPVLRSQRSGPGGRGNREPETSSIRQASTTGLSLGGPAAVPPVLNSPAKTSAQPAPGVPPKKPRRTAGKPQRPDNEWVGTETARADASTPILDAPEAAVTGSAVSKLEEVPPSLRGGRAVRSEALIVPGPGPGLPPAEPSPRRSTSYVTQPAVIPARADDGPKIVTDEEAFSVETPGGGVLAKAQTTRSYRVEPPPALGGGS
jgi:hypothetical protein